VVGEFSQASTSYVREAAAFFGLDAVQVPAAGHGSDWSVFEGLTVLATLSGSAPEIDRLFAEKAPYVAYFLVDITDSIDAQTGVLADSNTWKKRCANYPVLLHADLAPAHWPTLIESVRPAGIGLAGDAEERVGVKSFDEIEEIFDALENANLLA
jgi:phosphoribosylanthranilate isomerase